MLTPSEKDMKVKDLIQGFRTALLITRRNVEELHARPMAIVRAEPHCISFFTAFDSPKVNEILRHPVVLVTMQNDSAVSVTVSGTAVISRDRTNLTQKWNESFRPWFPGGLDDPDLTLIDVFPERIEYWDSTGWNRVKYLFEAARAYVTGQTPDVEEGTQHGVMRN